MLMFEFQLTRIIIIIWIVTVWIFLIYYQGEVSSDMKEMSVLYSGNYSPELTEDIMTSSSLSVVSEVETVLFLLCSSSFFLFLELNHLIWLFRIDMIDFSLNFFVEVVSLHKSDLIWILLLVDKLIDWLIDLIITMIWFGLIW